MDTWYVIDRPGRQHGPLSHSDAAKTIQSGIPSGAFGPESEIWHQSFGATWKTIATSEFAHLLGQPSPPRGPSGSPPYQAPHTRPTIGEAVIAAVTTKYATFSGRARRSEYWCFILFWMIFYFVAAVVDAIIGSIVVVTLLLTLALLLPGLAVTVRRLHDTGKSGWWILIYLVPIVGPFVMIVFLCIDSQPGDNVYGPNPKAQIA